jgi:hypothetical protein
MTTMYNGYIDMTTTTNKEVTDMKNVNVFGHEIVLGDNGLVASDDGFPVYMKYWTGNGMVRYYVSRANKNIGWIASDLKSGKGMSSTEQAYINRYIGAMAE